MTNPIGPYRICLSTVGNLTQAQDLARTLLQQKLVACVSISSKVASLYHWQGEIVEDEEFLLMMKTSSQKLGSLQDILLEIHPYDVPEFIVIDIDSGSSDYFNWIDSVLR